MMCNRMAIYKKEINDSFLDSLNGQMNLEERRDKMKGRKRAQKRRAKQ